MSSGVAFAATGHTPWQAPEAPAGAHIAVTSDAPSDGGTPTTDPHTHGFRGLCHAYLSGNKAIHGRALQSPAFVALVTAAGGVDAVAGFCATAALPPTHPSRPAHLANGPSSDHPTQPTHPVHPTPPVHPAHPTQGVDPTHPAHPPHPTHS